MKPKVFLICGKLCCGKSTYAEKLRRTTGAVVLSCDELVLSILGNDLGEKHDEILERVKAYLFTKAVEILNAGSCVILEWGFWKKSDRDYARDFFSRHGYSSELHCLLLTDDQWHANIQKRNAETAQGTSLSYFVDEGLLQKLEGLFEPPSPEEADVWYRQPQ